MEQLLRHLASLTPGSVYLTLAGLLLLCGLGLPLPEDVSLISGGYMAHKGVVNVHSVLLVCFAAVLSGDITAYFLGRWAGRRILAWHGAERFLSRRKQLRVRAYFRKLGSKVIFIGRFLPGLRFTIFFSAGMMHVRPAVFVIYDGLAAMVSVPAMVYLAYLFGERIDQAVSWAHRSEYGILVIALVAAGVLALRTFRHRRKHRRHLAAIACPPAEAPSALPRPARRAAGDEG